MNKNLIKFNGVLACCAMFNLDLREELNKNFTKEELIDFLVASAEMGKEQQETLKSLVDKGILQ